MKAKLVFFLFSITLSLFLLEASLSQDSVCEGFISISFPEENLFVGDAVPTSITGLRGEGCTNKRVYVKEGSCDGLQYCSCLLNRVSEGLYGCVCTFRAPSTPYIAGKGPARESTFTYYVCADLNDNGIYETSGEQSYANLLVYSRYAPLGMLTESIFIIVSLGILAILTVIVLGVSFRKR